MSQRYESCMTKEEHEAVQRRKYVWMNRIFIASVLTLGLIGLFAPAVK